MRINTWEDALANYIAIKRHEPFEYGVNDCCLFAAGAAEQFAEERRVIGALIGKANQVEAVTANFEKRKTAFIDPA
jgi:hypothetical protein